MLKDMVEPSRVVRRLEVITGAGGRRRWSAVEKARILQETLAPGAVVSQVARRYGLSPQHLFTWHRLARRTMAAAPQTSPVTFVPAVIAPAASEPAPPPPARPGAHAGEALLPGLSWRLRAWWSGSVRMRTRRRSRR